MRMIQGRGCLRFLDEPLQSLWVRSQGLWENLDRDRPIQFSILGQIHLSHSALANLRADFIAAESCAGVNRHEALFANIRIALYSSAPAQSQLLADRLRIRLF